MQDRDKALVIGGACASMLEMPTIAKFCRSMVLQRNHGHMLKRWETFDEAMEYEDFHLLLKQILKKIPDETAYELLEDFDYRCEVRKEDHSSNESFAAAVLGVDYDWLMEHFGE